MYWCQIPAIPGVDMSTGLLQAVMGRGWGVEVAGDLLSPQTSRLEHLNREARSYAPIFVPKVLFLPGFWQNSVFRLLPSHTFPLSWESSR